MSTHAIEIARGERFEFGKNGSRFLALLDEARASPAEESLKQMLEVERRKHSTAFLENQNVAERRPRPPHVLEPEVVKSVNEPLEWLRGESRVALRELAGNAPCERQSVRLKALYQPSDICLAGN